MCVYILVVNSVVGENHKGSNIAVIGQFKFAVHIDTNVTMYGNDSLTSILSSCTGVILNENYVLAPAFCLRDITYDVALDGDSTVVSSVLTVRAGTLVGSARTYVEYGSCMQERIIPINHITFRPMNDTDDDLQLESSDLVLVKVNPTFDFGPCVGVIGLMKKPFPREKAPTCWSVTFSNSQITTVSGTRGLLKYRRVTAGDKGLCKQLQRNEHIVWEDHHVCSKTFTMIDTCDEDWTGPLICETKEGMRLVGVDNFYFGTRISWLKSTCQHTNDVYKAYAMPGYFQEWITTTTNGTSNIVFDTYQSPPERIVKRRRRNSVTNFSRQQRPSISTIFLLVYLMLIT